MTLHIGHLTTHWPGQVVAILPIHHRMCKWARPCSSCAVAVAREDTSERKRQPRRELQVVPHRPIAEFPAKSLDRRDVVPCFDPEAERTPPPAYSRKWPRDHGGSNRQVVQTPLDDAVVLPTATSAPTVGRTLIVGVFACACARTANARIETSTARANPTLRKTLAVVSEGMLCECWLLCDIEPLSCGTCRNTRDGMPSCLEAVLYRYEVTRVQKVPDRARLPAITRRRPSPWSGVVPTANPHHVDVSR